MGVDYSPVSGIGIKVNKDIEKKLIVANGGEFYDCIPSLLEDLDLLYSESGSGSYTGNENDYFIMVEGDTLLEINENSQSFIDKLDGFGIKVTESDLVLINELHVR